MVLEPPVWGSGLKTVMKSDWAPLPSPHSLRLDLFLWSSYSREAKSLQGTSLQAVMAESIPRSLGMVAPRGGVLSKAHGTTPPIAHAQGMILKDWGKEEGRAEGTAE